MTIAESGWLKGSAIRTARKEGKCAGFRQCGTRIQPGDKYVEGDPQYDIAGGFGRERYCLACAKLETALAKVDPKVAVQEDLK